MNFELLKTILESPAVGVVGGAVVAVLAFLIKDFFGNRDKNHAKLEKSIDDLTKGLNDFKEKTQSAFGAMSKSLTKVAEAVKVLEVKLSAETEVLKNDVRHYSTDVAKLEGKIENQLELVSTHISTIGHMSRQLNRLFEFVDATKRPADLADKKSR